MSKLDQGIATSGNRYRVIPRTLCLITHGDDLLLMRRSTAKPVWPLRRNGVGGHVERDEDVLTAALREIHEETGLEVRALQLRGVVNIDAGDPRSGILLFIFSAEAASREFTSSREGTLQWVPREDVLDLPLFEDLPLILPQVLDAPAGQTPFFAHYSYDEADVLVVTFAGHQNGDLSGQPDEPGAEAHRQGQRGEN